MGNSVDSLRKMTQPASKQLSRKEEQGQVQCLCCAHHCRISPGEAGICGIRWNHQGQLYVPYGYISSCQLDPLEKKPFYHVYPGQQALSLGNLGCNLSCPYCQNWTISQVPTDPAAAVRYRQIEPEEIVGLAEQTAARAVIATYNEPLISSEWWRQIFRLVKQEGYLTGYVSNGYVTAQTVDYLRPFTDLFNLDFKGWSPGSYQRLGGRVEPVKQALKIIYQQEFHLEVITLLIPRVNDDAEELTRMADFLANISVDIPWHLTAFQGAYRWKDHPSTPAKTLQKAYDIARSRGMKYVYCGNLPGQVGEAEKTCCPGCRKVLVDRRGYELQQVELTGDSCPGCGEIIYGIYGE